MVKDDNLFGKLWPARRGKPPIIYGDGFKPKIGIKDGLSMLPSQSLGFMENV